MISKARGHHSLICNLIDTDLKSSRENYGQSSNDFFVSADRQT